MAKARTRVSYSRELRAEAKGQGLLTISMEFANGERLEEQGTFGPQDLLFAKWAMAMLFCDRLRKLPDLEKVVKDLMEGTDR